MQDNSVKELNEKEIYKVNGGMIQSPEMLTYDEDERCDAKPVSNIKDAFSILIKKK